MTIPEIRDRLHGIAVELRGDDADIDMVAAELDALAEQTRRRPNGNVAKAPVSSITFTPELADAIRAYKIAFPGATMNRIGHVLGVNQGRVSEALYGKRA